MLNNNNLIRTVLSMSPEQQELWVREIYWPRPWKHDFYPVKCEHKREEYECRRCPTKFIVDYNQDPPAQTPGNCPVPPPLDKSLAEIAFEMSSKVFSDKFIIGCEQVFCSINGSRYVDNRIPAIEWFVSKSQPIHWILAAHLAGKEQ